MKLRRWCRRHEAWHTAHGDHVCRHIACETARRAEPRRDLATRAHEREAAARGGVIRREMRKAINAAERLGVRLRRRLGRSA